MALLFHAIAGFIAPHLGSVVDLIKTSVLARMDKERSERVAELELQRIIQTPTEPAGARFLSALESSKYNPPKFMVGLVLLFYVFLDWCVVIVKPGITWVVIALWVAYGIGNGWTEHDHQILIMILAYWFSDITLGRSKK